MAEGIVPGPRDAMINFYAVHQPIWEAAQASIGISIEQAAALKAAVEKAVASQANADTARSNSKTMTDRLNADAAALRALGGGLMSTIRAYAETTGNDDVYTKSDLPMPKPPTPAPPPEAPTAFSADPNADGTISLKWKGSIAQAGSFDIERSIDGGAFVFIKNVRGKKFTDDKVPSNLAMITYRAYGSRANVRSTASASTQVLFGNLPPALQAAFRSAKGGAASKAA